MDGLAVERAALAANADSAKNSTPIHPEDRQPNESLRRRKGAGPPIVVPMLRGRMRGGMQGGNNQGHWNNSRHWKTQDKQQRYGAPSSSSWPSSQSANGGVFRPLFSDPYNPWLANSSSSGIANRDVPSPHPPIRRGRPLPLPPRQENNRSDTGRTTIPVDDVVHKPYSNNLPTLKPRPAFSWMVAKRTLKPAPTVPKSFSPGMSKERREEIESPRPSLERDRERRSSPKRRKIDDTRPALIHNNVGEGILSNDVAQTIPPTELRYSDECPSTSTTTSEQPLLTPSPPTTRKLVSPPIIKREPESPPPLIEERKIVTTYVTRFPLPENCQKTNPQWQINRMPFRQEKVRELRKKGLEIIGPCVMRDDGMCIEWKSSVPLWSDTLEPISLTDNEQPCGGSRFSTPTNPTSGRSHIDNAMGPPSTRRTTNVVERSSPVLPSQSPSQVSQQQAHVLPFDVQSVATVSPSPAGSDGSRKSHRSQFPRGSLDLATAIEISQRTNATPSRPQSFRSSSTTLDSPGALATQCLTYPSMHSSYPPVTSPSVKLSRTPRRNHRDAKLREGADRANKGKDDGDDIKIIEDPEQSRNMEAVKAGWTVIEDICQSSEKGGSEEAEDDYDELVEDNDLREVRADEGLDQVAPVSLSTKDDEDDDTVARNFINGYMQLFETDRDSLVSLYAPDAILRYRLLDITQLPSTSSPKGLSSFPFMTARGHKDISSSLLTIDHVHFYQKVDEDGKNKIDLEYHREQTNDDISLYFRSTMTVDEDNEVPGTHEHPSDDMEWQQKRLVDHDFWLCRDRSTRTRSTATEGHGPFLIRSHLIIMHEAPL